jgi:hypothetical protein
MTAAMHRRIARLEVAQAPEEPPEGLAGFDLLLWRMGQSGELARLLREVWQGRHALPVASD